MNHTLTLRMLGVALALAVITIPRSVALAGQGPPDRDAVLAQLKQALSEAGRDLAFADPEKRYAVSPDGRYFAGTLKSKGESVSVVVDLEQKRIVSDLGDIPVESPTFSPGTKWVAFAPSSGSRDTGTLIVELASGQVIVAIISLAAERQESLHWRDATTVEFSFKAREGGSGHCLWEVDHPSGRCEVPLATRAIDINKERVDADETAAMAFLRTVNTAAATYASTYNVGYPKSLAAMGESSDGTVTQEHAGLIDKTLAGGKKSGYTITYRPGPVVDGGIQTYTVVARPVRYGKTGTKSFFTDQTGIIRGTNEDREPTANDPPVGG